MPVTTYAIILLIGLVPLIPALIYFRYRHNSSTGKSDQENARRTWWT